MSSNDKLISSALLVAVSAGLALLLAEWLIYEFFPQKTLYPRYQTTRDYRLTFPPNARLEHAQGELWSFSYATNELGHRGELIPVSTAANSINIVALGDSFTFGMGVADGQEYPRPLADALGPRFAVLNAGMAGWGIDSEIKRYYEYFSDYQPRYVILQFTQNDPYDSRTGVTTIRNGEFVFADYDWQKPGWQQMLSDSEFLQNSQLYAAIRHIIETAGDLRENQTSSAAGQSEQEQNYAAMLATFAQRLRNEGSQLLFLSVTHRHSDVYHYDSDHFPEIGRVLDELSSQGLLHVIELPLAELEQYQGSLEGHQWNIAHHRIVGRTAAAAILELEKQRESAAPANVTKARHPTD